MLRGASRTLLAPKRSKSVSSTLRVVKGDISTPTPSTTDAVPPPRRFGVAVGATSTQKRAVVNHLRIGDVSLPIYEEINPERIPCGLPAAAFKFFPLKSRETLGYLRWIAQKELLGQDVCIIGDPGPAKRWIAMIYAQVARREVQLLSLSRDTTEADIKQRKEVQNGTLLYVNQAAVTAALEGQILVIDGLERAERNVLPVINNLLENREMHLDNGMMLIAPQRYDELCHQHGTSDLSSLGLLRVSEHFRVIGLTVPTPRFAGTPLDPPLRSRFQCMFLHSVLAFGGGDSDTWASTVDHSALSRASTNLVPKSIRDSTAGETITRFRATQSAVDGASSDRDRARAMPGLTDLDHYLWATQAAAFPKEPLGNILERVYPWRLYTKMGNKSELEKKQKDCIAVLQKFGLLPTTTTPAATGGTGQAIVRLVATSAFNAAATTLDGTVIEGVPCGALGPDSSHPVLAGPTGVSRSYLTSAHVGLLQSMLQSHICGRHIAVSGLAGGGKTAAAIREFAAVLGYPVEVHHLYADMSTRDLLQRRSTDPKDGSTTWELSPLMEAVRDGKLAVLDGVDQLPPGSLAILQELLLDGSITLFDGSVFKNPAAYNELRRELLGDGPDMDGGAADAELASRRIFKVHPSFRLIVTCRYPEPDTSSKKTWLTSDIVSLFNWHVLPELEAPQVLEVLKNVTARFANSHPTTRLSIDDAAPVTSPNLAAPGFTREDLVARQSSREYADVLAKLVSLQSALDGARVMDPKVPRLSLRQLIHVAQHVLFFPTDLQGTVESALLMPLMNPLLYDQVRSILSSEGITMEAAIGKSTTSEGASGRLKNTLAALVGMGGRQAPSATLIKHGNESTATQPFTIERTSSTPSSTKLKVMSYGSEILSVTREYTAAERALVPHVPHFHPNPRQRQLQAWLAKNIASKSSILLVGNQGVGKNKVVDQFLAETGLPRHYLQLHRDTTVSSLTISPSVVGGKVTWEDSPLVKAAQRGHVLVVDEIDKAPVEVVHILKGLIEDREMKLGDGRKISGWYEDASGASASAMIPIHPDFRIIVLANPPGFPFHGNDFYRECGDLFSCYVMQNPDAASQEDLLRKVGPDVPEIVLKRLVGAFGDLSSMFKEGALSYPFSLRELIAVVKHLQAFPQDGLLQAVNNVFNFDLLDANTMAQVRAILHEKFANIRDQDLMAAAKPLRVAHELQLGKLEKMAHFVVDSSGSSAGGAISADFTLVEEDVSPPGATIILSAMPVFGAVNVDATQQDSASHQTEVVGAADLSHFFAVEATANGRGAVAGGDIEIKMVKQFGSSELQSTDLYSVGGDTNQGALTASSGIPLSILVTNCNTIWIVRARHGGSRSSAGVSGGGEEDLLGVRLGVPVVDGIPLEIVEVLGTSEQLSDTLELPSRSSEASACGDFVHFVVRKTGSEATQLMSIPLADAITNVDEETSPTLACSAFLSSINFANSPAPQKIDTAGFSSFGSLCVAHSDRPTLSILYAGKRIRVDFTKIKSDHLPPRVTILKVTQFASQLYLICFAETSPTSGAQYTFGILKLAVFHNAVMGKLHPVLISDISKMDGSSNKDPRVRTTVAETVRLLLTESSLVGYGKGDGGVPSTSTEVAASDLQDALFVMNSVTATNGVVRKGDVLYALADVTPLAVSDDGSPCKFMVTLNGFVNTASDPMQLTTASGDGRANSGDTSVAWSKVGATSSRHGAGGVSGASVSADYAHHQLVAGGTSAGSSIIHAVSTHKGTIRHFPAAASNSGSSSADAISVSGNSGLGVAVDSTAQSLTSFDTNAERLKEVHERWSNVLKGRAGGLGQPYRGGDDAANDDGDDPMSMQYNKPRKPPSADNLKRGEEDPDNDPHVGGNNWAGGTGGTDTAGLGGLVGPYRLDKGHPIHQVDPKEKKKVPQHIIDEARKMGKEALQKRLEEINMSASEDARYRGCYERVQGPIQQLRTILQGLKVRETERGWVRHQTDGIWDDNKLVEGITGEKTVYKRRVDVEEDNPLNRSTKDNADGDDHKKRLLFVLDVSASMYRFNSMDGRLNRLVECAIMIMESFKGFEDKIDYSIVGHSGDSDELPLVDFGKPPTNKKERMNVCMKMVAFSQFCWSGDNTVSAMRKSVRTVTAKKAESHFVFVVSDANLAQYGIHPSDLSRIIRSDPAVHMYCIFIASFGAQARSIQKHLPVGHGFECLQTDELPQVLKQIFTATDLLT